MVTMHLVSLSSNNCSLDSFPPKNKFSYALSHCVKNSRSEKSFCQQLSKIMELGEWDWGWQMGGDIYILIIYWGNKGFSSFDLESNIGWAFPG